MVDVIFGPTHFFCEMFEVSLKVGMENHAVMQKKMGRHLSGE